MVMFTMLVLLTSGAILLVSERERGLLRRLAATPISRGSIVLGKWVARMALALVQIGFAMALGSLVFKVDWGSSLPTVALVLATWAAFNASLAMMLAGVARSSQQMAGLGVLGTMVLAALGGCWWPIEITPRWMQRRALVLPSGWCMDAMHRLVSFGYGAESAWPHALALAVGASLLGWLGTRQFRYQ
jgi:ABC-type multidrug transport system permease subunit